MCKKPCAGVAAALRAGPFPASFFLPHHAFFGNPVEFFGISLLLALSPGPDKSVCAGAIGAARLARGPVRGAGLCSGLVACTSAVALGLAAVLAASPLAFQLLQWLGAAYLCWLAWGAWHAPVSLEGAQASAIRSPWRGGRAAC